MKITISSKSLIFKPVEKPFPKSAEIFVLWGLALISFLAWFFYFRQGLTLSYNDAGSHLNVARRVVDSLQPGFAQVGSVWLPLYHILELPFIWNDYFWRSGLAGSIISMISYALGGFYLIKLTRKLNFDKVASSVALLVYALNPNLLFMQTTPMTESLLIFLSISSIYYIISWVKSGNLSEILLSALFVFLTTLTRYDGWFLFLFSTLVIYFVAKRKRNSPYPQGNTILFLSLASFGVILWFLWNLIIFRDPLYFATGPFSAKAQQDVLSFEGRLLTKGNFVYSFFIYLLAANENIGIWLGVLSLLGVYLFLRSKDYSWKIKLASGLLLTPVLFNVASLFAGHSVIHLPYIPPYTWFNDRYGLMILPAAAIAVGFLAKRRVLAGTLIFLVLVTQSINMYLNNKIITIEDGVRGASGEFLSQGAAWIKQNANQGLIFVAASSNDSLIFKSGLPLKSFVTEGARKYWDASIVDPTVFATWVVMHKGDLVHENLKNNENFLKNFRLVYKDTFTYIYKLERNTNSPLGVDQLPI